MCDIGEEAEVGAGCGVGEVCDIGEGAAVGAVREIGAERGPRPTGVRRSESGRQVGWGGGWYGEGTLQAIDSPLSILA